MDISYTPPPGFILENAKEEDLPETMHIMYEACKNCPFEQLVNKDVAPEDVLKFLNLRFGPEGIGKIKYHKTFVARESNSGYVMPFLQFLFEMTLQLEIVSVAGNVMEAWLIPSVFRKMVGFIKLLGPHIKSEEEERLKKSVVGSPPGFNEKLNEASMALNQAQDFGYNPETDYSKSVNALWIGQVAWGMVPII